MPDNIKYIHANKLAKYLKEYVGKDGTVYVGQKDGRLAKKRVTSEDLVNLQNSVSGGVQSVTASNPLSSSGGINPNITISQASPTSDGYITAADYITFSSATSGGPKYGIATQVSAGVYTSTITGVTTYTAGDVYVIKFTSVNDGASTLNINALGAKSIFKNTAVPLSSGDLKTNQTVELVYDGTNFQAIGIIPTQLLAYVHNAEGAIISKGQVVYAYQATGNKMSVKLAKANSDATSAKTVGMVYDSSIGIGADGYIIIQGVIEGINTAAYTTGDTLYLSGTTFGLATNVKPYAPTHLVYVGIVERANAGNGQIYVRCQNGYELDEIHDVDLISTPPVNGDVLTYVTGTPNLWKSKSISSILGYTPQPAITLTTTGTSGPSTLIGSTLNVPEYQSVSKGFVIAMAVAL